MRDVDSLRDQLNRVLASPQFDASERNRRFLSYVVEKAIEGHPDRIKAYTIAIDVFGRAKDFDPQLDSIVRIEAGRLRRSLERYYLTEGANDPVRILIPRGSYVPVFADAGSSADAALPASAAPRRREGIRNLLVEPFEQDGEVDRLPNFSVRLTRQVVVGLTRFTNLVVFGPRNGHEDPAARPDFVLRANTTISGRMLRTDVFLVEPRSGQ
jgi:adenylate cyclase